MRKHITSASTLKQEGSTKTASMALTDFVDQMGTPSFSAVTLFPSLTDFSAAVAADALKWTDLEQNAVYQIVSTRTVNTQHG